METEITFGVMCMGNQLPKWEADCINNLVSNKKIKLKLIILDCPENYVRQSIWKKILKFKFSHLFFSLYDKFLFKPAAKKGIDLSHLFDISS